MTGGGVCYVYGWVFRVVFSVQGQSDVAGGDVCEYIGTDNSIRRGGGEGGGELIDL